MYVCTGITGMRNATTNNSLSKICNPHDQSVNRPLSKVWEIALPTPRIDAPGSYIETRGGSRLLVI